MHTCSNGDEHRVCSLCLQQGVDGLGHAAISSRSETVIEQCLHLFYHCHVLASDVGDVGDVCERWEGEHGLGVYQGTQITAPVDEKTQELQ